MFVAKVLGIMRKCPAAPLPLPLGEVSPQVTERAHAVSLIAKVFKCNEETLQPLSVRLQPSGGSRNAKCFLEK